MGCPREESNLYRRVRSAVLCPLSYEGMESGSNLTLLAKFL